MSLIYINPYSFAGIVTSGLVLYLDAANPASYPGSGTTWADLSGIGNTGTLTNGPTFNPADGGSIVFDGSNDFIDFTSDSSLLPTNGLTVSTWFKTAIADKWLVNKSSNGLNGYRFAGNSNGTIGFVVNAINATSPTTIATGGWLNIVGTWTPSTSLLLYRNGSQVASNTTSIPASITNPSFTLEIGRRFSNTDHWDGSVAQVLIYNRAITAAEVTQNFDALRGRYGL